MHRIQSNAILLKPRKETKKALAMTTF